MGFEYLQFLVALEFLMFKYLHPLQKSVFFFCMCFISLRFSNIECNSFIDYGVDLDFVVVAGCQLFWEFRWRA